MTTWNIHNKIIWRISGGRYPTLYVALAKDNNPLEISKEIRIPVPPVYARDDKETMRMIEETEKDLIKTT